MPPFTSLFNHILSNFAQTSLPFTFASIWQIRRKIYKKSKRDPSTPRNSVDNLLFTLRISACLCARLVLAHHTKLNTLRTRAFQLVADKQGFKGYRKERAF